MNALHIVVAMKPVQGNYTENALSRGVAGLNIDAARIGSFVSETPSGYDRLNKKQADMGYRPGEYQMGEAPLPTTEGRWPANILHDGSEEVAEQFPVMAKQGAPKKKDTADTGWFGGGAVSTYFGDDGSAARFFKECKE